MSEFIAYGKDGPVFARACSGCHRYLSFPAEMRWREDFTGACRFIAVDCPRCGPVDPEHVGWMGDFR